MNLLQETKELLAENGKTIFDIEWFGTAECEYICDLQQLLNIEYNDGFGCAEIPEDFILVGEDFWLERHEYDGAEWWEYKTMPIKPKESKSTLKLIEWK